MEYRPIKTDWQYRIVAERIEQLQDADPYTPEADELRLLTEMLVDYELRMVASNDNPSDASEPISPV